MKRCFILYSINVYSIINAIIKVLNYCEMMEICIYIDCILVLWIILSIQNPLGKVGRDQGDEDGWAWNFGPVTYSPYTVVSSFVCCA